MAKQASGFLADDGTFFEHEPECKRYEAMKELSSLCDTHETNFEAFLAFLNGWHTTIQEYYNADSQCLEPNQGKSGPLPDEPDDLDAAIIEELPAFLHTEADKPYLKPRDKDAKGFLEQQIRGRK